jgi:hypothetical protein
MHRRRDTSKTTLLLKHLTWTKSRIAAPF